MRFLLRVVRVSLCSFLFVFVSIEAFLVFAVFCVIETSLDKEGLVAILPVFGVVAEESSTVVFPSIIDLAEDVEETVSVVFPSIIVFAVDVLDILGFRWQIVNLPFVSVVFSPV